MIKQAVLLAAGIGSRLLPLTKDYPKCLVEVNGRPIIDSLLDALRELFVHEIIVVTGYKADTLEAYLQSQEDFECTFIHNDLYATTNNIVSLHVAAEVIRPPFLLVESDIYLEPRILSPLSEPDQILVAPYTPQMDGTGICIGAGNRVSEMVIRAHVARPDTLQEMFKTVNFYSFSEATWNVYRRALDTWVRDGRLDQYYEAVLAELINDGRIQMQAANVGLDGWGEVDNADDLTALNLSLRKKNSTELG